MGDGMTKAITQEMLQTTFQPILKHNVGSRVRSANRSDRFWQKECCRVVEPGETATSAQTVVRTLFGRLAVGPVSDVKERAPSNWMHLGAVSIFRQQ